MHKVELKNVFIVLLLAITAFSSYKYATLLREKYTLAKSLYGAKQQIAGLEEEKRNLLQDIKKEKLLQEELSQRNSRLKGYLDASKKRLNKLLVDYQKAQQEIDDLSSRFSVLQAEHAAAKEEKERLARKNNEFKTKLNSVSELKKRIRELRSGKGLIYEMTDLAPEEAGYTLGNQGFLLREGKSTFPGSVKIEVIPAGENSEP